LLLGLSSQEYENKYKTMITLQKNIKNLLIFCLLCSLFFFSGLIGLSAHEINWKEVDNTNSGIQSIDVDSIKYNSNGYLSVITKFSEVNQDDQTLISSDSYLMAVDCENRLFSKLPLNGELRQVKKWEEPVNDRLIKKTILISCTL
tara:strand:- start:160 stop:597 length:438 start_codon:yes stop_codon:yes gene_type:complete